MFICRDVTTQLCARLSGNLLRQGYISSQRYRAETKRLVTVEQQLGHFLSRNYVATSVREKTGTHSRYALPPIFFKYQRVSDAICAGFVTLFSTRCPLSTSLFAQSHLLLVTHTLPAEFRALCFQLCLGIALFCLIHQCLRS